MIKGVKMTRLLKVGDKIITLRYSLGFEKDIHTVITKIIERRSGTYYETAHTSMYIIHSKDVKPDYINWKKRLRK